MLTLDAAFDRIGSALHTRDTPLLEKEDHHHDDSGTDLDLPHLAER